MAETLNFYIVNASHELSRDLPSTEINADSYAIPFKSSGGSKVGPKRAQASPFSKISVISDKIRLLTEEVGKENSYKCSTSKWIIKLKLKGFIVAHSAKYYKFTLEYLGGH